MILFKLKIVAALLGTSASAYREGRHHMVSRASADVYSIPGEGEVYTKGCTYNAKRQEVDIDVRDGRRWVTFLDDLDEEEANCELTWTRPWVPHPVSHVILRTKPATTR